MIYDQKNSKTANTDLLFFIDKHCQSLTDKLTGEFLAAKTLREKFGGLNVMKSVLSSDETPSTLERSFKGATKLGHELPTNIEMESIPLGSFSIFWKIFMLIHGKDHKILSLTFENFLGSIRLYKAYRVNF